MKRIIPAPKSSEKSPMNFWSMKISLKMPTAQSSQVPEPPVLRFRYGGRSNLNDTAFISSMPSTATPRMRSRLVIRADSRTALTP